MVCWAPVQVLGEAVVGQDVATLHKHATTMASRVPPMTLTELLARNGPYPLLSYDKSCCVVVSNTHTHQATHGAGSWTGLWSAGLVLDPQSLGPWTGDLVLGPCRSYKRARSSVLGPVRSRPRARSFRREGSVLGFRSGSVLAAEPFGLWSSVPRFIAYPYAPLHKASCTLQPPPAPRVRGGLRRRPPR